MQAQPLTILVTGSSSGFGRFISEELATRSHRVLATMRDVEGRNRAAAAELEEGSEGIAVLVNNAGGGYLGILEAFSVPRAQRPPRGSRGGRQPDRASRREPSARTTVGWGAQRAYGVNAVSEELQRSVLDGLGEREQLSLAGHQATTTEV